MRRLVVGIVALVLAAVVVRNAAVDALADTNPVLAAQLWSTHPDVELALGMTEIAKAARDRKPVPPQAFQSIDDAARKAPLAPEPFLVSGVGAQMAGRTAAAERLFLEAQWRDPRSLPAHYFLADHYFRTRDAARGLTQIAILANLSPGGVQGSAPYIAAYARDPANWPRLRAVFRANPELESAALTTLSADAANADVILALTPPSRRTVDSLWLQPLLNSMVGAGEYAKAKAIWASVSGVGSASQMLLFDPQFARSRPPPPFNWTLTSSTVGLAERQPGGRLHAIFYGQEDGVLARQLLVLPPGQYRLSMRLSGDLARARALSWSLQCATAQSPAATVPLNVAAARGWMFEVTADCPAQWLQLSGTSSDMPQQSDVTLSGLRLDRQANHD